MPSVDLKVFPVETPRNPQTAPPQPLLCGRYPLTETFVLTLSGCGTRYGCDLAGGSYPVSFQSDLITQSISIVSWVHG